MNMTYEQEREHEKLLKRLARDKKAVQAALQRLVDRYELGEYQFYRLDDNEVLAALAYALGYRGRRTFVLKVPEDVVVRHV